MNPKSLKGLKDLTSQLIDKPKLIDKLDELRIRYAEITIELEKPDTYKDRRLSDKLHKERSKLEKPVNQFMDYQKVLKEIEVTEKLILSEEDKDLKTIAQEDLENYTNEKDKLEKCLMEILVEKDPNDSKDIFSKIHGIDL